jgi:hypothetical protein
MGCIKGCLEYLESDVSFPWLYGGTGHAFIINVHEVVCPSGPTAWHTEMLFKLGRNVGYTIDGIWGPATEEKQQAAWDKLRAAMDEGLPCYGWELQIPEFYVVNGYDDTGYYFSGPLADAGAGPKPWKEVGATQIGVLEMYSLRLSRPADDATTVKEALQFALEHAGSPSKWIYPKYRAGLDGFDLWIRALEENKADAMGMAYNAAVCHECRAFAHQFLAEAKKRIGKEAALFDEAEAHYKEVAGVLKTVADLFPFLGTTDEEKKKSVEDAERRTSALAALGSARAAEEKGLDSLGKIAKAL